MHYSTSFRDVIIDSVPNQLFSGIASWELDDVFEEFFVTKLELFNLFGTTITLTRRNKDQGLNLIFSQIEDVLMDRAAENYDRPTRHYFYEGLAS